MFCDFWAFQDIEHGSLGHWNTMLAPEIARQYWELKVIWIVFKHFSKKFIHTALNM